MIIVVEGRCRCRIQLQQESNRRGDVVVVDSFVTVRHRPVITSRSRRLRQLRCQKRSQKFPVGLGSLHVSRVVAKVVSRHVPSINKRVGDDQRIKLVRVPAGTRARNGRKGPANILNYIEASVNDPIAMA